MDLSRKVVLSPPCDYCYSYWNNYACLVLIEKVFQTLLIFLKNIDKPIQNYWRCGIYCWTMRCFMFHSYSNPKVFFFPLITPKFSWFFIISDMKPAPVVVFLCVPPPSILDTPFLIFPIILDWGLVILTYVRQLWYSPFWIPHNSK